MMTNTLLRSLMRHQFGDKTKSKFASLAFSTSCERYLYCGRLSQVIAVFIFCLGFGKKVYLKWNCEMKKKYEKMIHLPTVYKWIWGSFERKSAIRQNPKGPLCPTLGISWSVCIGGNFLKATFNSSTGLFADNDIARDAEFDVTDCWANRKK